MEKIIDKIIDVMKANDSLTDDEDIVRIGLEIMIMRGIFIIVIAIIGLLMRCFFESIVFTIAFSLLREYGGGSHAKSRKKCFVLSVLMLVEALGIIKLAEYMPFIIIFLVIVSIISVVYVVFSAPIDSENKWLDEDEIRVYGKKARILSLVLTGIYAVLLTLNLNNFACAVMIGIVMEAILMFTGYIQNCRDGASACAK